MKSICVAAVLLCLSGCASTGKTVHCDWRLRPINPPAATAKDKPTSLNPPLQKQGDGINPKKEGEHGETRTGA